MVAASRLSDRIARHWAERLGCSPTAFQKPGVTSAESTSADTVRLLRRGDALVVAVPEAAAGRSIATIHGPFVLTYVDASQFTPVDSAARTLDAGDESAFERLRDCVPDDEWRQASPTFRPGRTAGLFVDENLVAAATVTDTSFPDVGVVVAPDHRGRGYGRAVVSTVTAAAFDADPDAVVRYRTPASATASLSLAASLGFERWARGAVLVLTQAGSP